MLEYKNLTKYINSIHKVKNEIFKDYIMDSEITFRPGVLRLINELKKNNVRIAIVSSTTESCVAIEDSLRGLRSAVNANINVLVTPSIYTKNENFEEANIVVSSLGESEEPFKVIKGKAYGNKLVNFDLLNKIINH